MRSCKRKEIGKEIKPIDALTLLGGVHTLRSGGFCHAIVAMFDSRRGRAYLWMH